MPTLQEVYDNPNSSTRNPTTLAKRAGTAIAGAKRFLNSLSSTQLGKRVVKQPAEAFAPTGGPRGTYLADTIHLSAYRGVNQKNERPLPCRVYKPLCLCSGPAAYREQKYGRGPGRNSRAEPCRRAGWQGCTLGGNSMRWRPGAEGRICRPVRRERHSDRDHICRDTRTAVQARSLGGDLPPNARRPLGSDRRACLVSPLAGARR